MKKKGVCRWSPIRAIKNLPITPPPAEGPKNTYFWQVAEGGGPLFLASRQGGALIFGAKNFEKTHETHFSTRFGQK